MNNQKVAQLEKAIGQVPRISLALTPTPLEPLPRFSKSLGGPLIYLKRDDLTGLAYGGNKTRMLEFSLAEALRQGADTIVTGAAVQSNYCRQMAGACAKLGLDLHLVLRPVRPIDHTQVQGNHFLQRLFGAEITILETGDKDKQQAAIAAKAVTLRAAGKKVYVPRQAETVDLDVIAYAETALETVRQCHDLNLQPDQLYVCAFDTTQAGLGLGLAYLETGIRVKGISPLAGDPHRLERMAHIANQAAERLGLAFEMSAADFDNVESFVGDGYGLPTEAGLEAIRLLARTEGILLDPVYTSKAMAALMAHIRSGQLPADKPVIFVHTGGSPALFAYTDEVLGL
jgi:D-cysteine desulfhydrase family pyridoxal phosphate-dependent enzyme